MWRELVELSLDINGGPVGLGGDMEMIFVSFVILPARRRELSK